MVAELAPKIQGPNLIRDAKIGGAGMAERIAALGTNWLFKLQSSVAWPPKSYRKLVEQLWKEGIPRVAQCQSSKAGSRQSYSGAEPRRRC